MAKSTVWRAVLMTSIVWMFVGTMVLFYFLEPGNQMANSAEGVRYVFLSWLVDGLCYRAINRAQRINKVEYEKPDEAPVAKKTKKVSDVDPEVQKQLDELLNS